MTEKNQEIHRHRSSTLQQFLVSKTDATVQDIQRVKEPSVAMKELLKRFPRILTGRAFINSVIPIISSLSELGAIAIQIDDLTGSMGQELGETSQEKEIRSRKDEKLNLLVDMTKIMNKLSESSESSSGGAWGVMENDIFVSLLVPKPGLGSEGFRDFSLSLADKIRRYISEHWNETLTIGIAWYPFFHFKKEQLFENACKALNHATFYGPGGTACFDAISLNISGDNLYQTGDIQGAVEEFKSGIQVDPANVNIHNSLGVCYGVMGDYENALSHFKSAISLEPSEIMAIYNTGLVYMFKGDKKKAVEFFLKADKLGEDVFEVAFQIGRICFELGKYKQGKSFLKKAIRIRPESGSALRYLGECYMSLNMTDEAMRAYKKALKQNPYDAASLSAIGHLFDMLNENPEISTVFCQHSVELAPENGLFRYRLGRLYLKQNRTEDALNQFTEAMKYGFNDAMLFIREIQEQKLNDDSRKLKTG